MLRTKVGDAGICYSRSPTTECRAKMLNTWLEHQNQCHVAVVRGELSYLAPLGSENISAPYFKQCFFWGGVYPPD